MKFNLFFPILFTGNIEPIPALIHDVIDHLIQWKLIPEYKRPNGCTTAALCRKGITYKATKNSECKLYEPRTNE